MYQNKKPHEACLDHHYHVYLDQNNSVRLKESSSWCIQIQGQMGVCKKSSICHDFMTWPYIGLTSSRKPLCIDIYLSDVLPPHKFEIKIMAPDGIIPIRALKVLWCL